MTTPTMTIAGVEYVEAPEVEEENCTGCAFVRAGSRACNTAIVEGLIRFGNSCDERRVIYLRKE